MGGDLTLATLDRWLSRQWWDAKTQKPKNITSWPRNMSVPIAVHSLADQLTKGEFEVYGMHMAVLGYWRVLALAKKHNCDASEIGKIKALGRNVPCDFTYFAPGEPVFLGEAKLLEAVL